jgi:DNA invertase Pin-like site-specific DNA recombinase
MNEKIQPRHFQRLAVVYVRQSSPTQVRNNRESPIRQRALQKRARELGWPADQILVLQEEQAKSASSTCGRHAYRQLAEAVVEDRVGIILAVEVGRWSRDSAAWQLLLRDCMFADVLLADEHKIYDPNDAHDHVFLGIQGALAEYELRIIRQRMLDCWWAKAQRGQVFTCIPTGYVEVRGQGLDKHPDRRVQHSLDRLFRRFGEMPSVLKLCQWYLEHDEPLPYVAHGDDPNQVQWLPANYKRLLWMFKNPAYTGAYVIGRTKTVVERNEEGELVRRRRSLRPDGWQVIEKDRFPAYISWQQYEENVTKIQKAATMHGDASRAAVQRGAGLLSGLLRCGRCGCPVWVRYEHTGQPRYVCYGGPRSRERGKRCLSFSGRYIEPLFSQTILEVVRPAGIAAAQRATELARQDDQQQRQRLLDELQQRQYETERARRQYDRVEPENRLVAGELERRWNEALGQATATQRRLQTFEQQSNPLPNEDEQRRLMELGQRLERVWDAETCDVTIKKQIVRLLVEEVIVDLDESRDEVELWIHWMGGHHTSLSAPRAGRRGYSRRAEAKAAISELRTAYDDRAMARILNRHGVPCGRDRWTAQSVRRFRQRHGIAPFDAEEKTRRGLLSQEEAAQVLGISPMSVHRLVQRGILPVEQPAPGMPCIIRQTDLALPEVHEAVHRIQSNLPRPLPDDPNQLKLF